MNIWTGIGRLGADPEVKFSNSGTAICNFTIAIEKKYKSKGKMVEKVNWLPMVCFGKTAENAGKYLSKGSEVAITGELEMQEWESKGEKKRKMVVLVSPFGLQFLSKTNKSREETRVENQDVQVDDPEIPF